jgi:hypothetical protein
LIQRLVRTLIAGAALAVAAGCAIVAACYALYALLRDPLGPAGAAAVTAIVMAVVALLIGLLFLRGSKPARGQEDDQDHGGPAAMLQQQALHLVRAKPLLAAGAGVVGLYILLRRPGLLALVGSNLLSMRVQKAKDRRRGLFG